MLDRAISKIRNILSARQQRTYTFIDSHQRFRFHCNEILYFEIKNHTLYIHLKNGGIYSVRKSLKELEQELDSAFCRIHTSYMINLQYLIYMSRDAETGKDIVVLEHCQERLPVGRAYKKKVNSAFIRFKEKENGL